MGLDPKDEARDFLLEVMRGEFPMPKGDSEQQQRHSCDMGLRLEAARMILGIPVLPAEQSIDD